MVAIFSAYGLKQSAAVEKPKPEGRLEVVERRYASPKRRPDRIPKAVEMIKAGRPTAEIMERLGYASEQAIYSIARRHGLKRQ